jgi:hypothetical protein
VEDDHQTAKWKRPSGHYWVSIFGELEIARWDGLMKLWFTIGCEIPISDDRITIIEYIVPPQLDAPQSYACRCFRCGAFFWGAKSDVTCRRCAQADTSEQYDSDAIAIISQVKKRPPHAE